MGKTSAKQSLCFTKSSIKPLPVGTTVSYRDLMVAIQDIGHLNLKSISEVVGVIGYIHEYFHLNGYLQLMGI